VARTPLDDLPDARDGLTRLERIVLTQLRALGAEQGGHGVPTAMLYGRVVEHIDCSVDELQAVLQRLTGKGLP
jgi:hypothetical protein